MNVPVLRFPDFEEEWRDKRLSDVVETVTSGSRDWAQYYSDAGAIFIRMTNIPRDGIQLLLSDLKYVTLPKSGSEGARTSLRGGDILVSITAELGKIGLVPDDLGEAYINQHTALVRPSKREVVPELLAQLLATKSSNKRLNRLNDSGAKAGLNLGTVRSFKVCFPSLPEQKKIAAFLGVVDAKIAALRARRDGLTRYKRGLMQALFSGRLRFTRSDGTAFPDWEENRLGEVAEIYQPQTISQTDLVSEGYTVYGANGIIGKYTKYNHEQAQVTVTCRGNTCGTVGFTEPYSWITGNAMVINLDRAGDTSKPFIYFLLSNTDWTYLITGSGQPQITGEIKKHKFQLPHPDEQSKIAEALSAMDAKIAAVKDQVTQMEAFKKGLLQQMFV